MQLYDKFSQAGVAPEFISQALKYDIEQMWYPSRTELANFGVVNLVELAAMRPPTRPTNIKKIEDAFQEVQISSTRTDRMIENQISKKDRTYETFFKYFSLLFGGDLRAVTLFASCR